MVYSKNIRKRAFTLVEVSLAIGIISFAMVATLGLMPVGLTTIRQAMDASIEGQIIKKVSGEILVTPFSKLSSAVVDKSFYFDDQGVQVTKPEDARFRISVEDAIMRYPGSSETPEDTPVEASMRLLKIKLVVTPGLNTTDAKARYYRILVSNSGT